MSGFLKSQVDILRGQMFGARCRAMRLLPYLTADDQSMTAYGAVDTLLDGEIMVAHDGWQWDGRATVRR